MNKPDYLHEIRRRNPWHVAGIHDPGPPGIADEQLPGTLHHDPHRSALPHKLATAPEQPGKIGFEVAPPKTTNAEAVP